MINASTKPQQPVNGRPAIQSAGQKSPVSIPFKEGDVDIELPGLPSSEHFRAAFYREPKNATERALMHLAEVLTWKASYLAEQNASGQFELHAPANDAPYLQVGILRIEVNPIGVEIVSLENNTFQAILPYADTNVVIHESDARGMSAYIGCFFRTNPNTHSA